jgi:hypothetical protein
MKMMIMLQKIPNIKRKRAIIVGNGTSRSSFDLNKIPLLSEVYSCGVAYKGLKNLNRINLYNVTIEEYRKKMLEEANLFSSSRILFPDVIEDHVESSLYHGHTGPRPRSNTGMYAMKCAILNGNSIIYILGFDSLIKNDTKQSISNMFDGAAETRTNAKDNPNRIRYLDWFMSHNNLVDFVFVFDKQYEFYNCQSTNMHGLSYELFEKELINEQPF